MSTAHKMVSESIRQKDLLGAHSHRLSYATSSYDPLVNATGKSPHVSSRELSSAY